LAFVTFIPTRRVILTALRRMIGSRNFVIALSLLLGLGLFLWARAELNAMFARDETGELDFRVTDVDPGCAAPSLYLVPDRSRPGSYYAAFDMLGGGISDPSIMNIGRPAVALSHGDGGADPLQERRSSLNDCRKMTLAIGPGAGSLVPLTPEEVAEISNVGWPDSAERTGADAVSFELGEEAGESAARFAFRIDGIRDVWQYGYRRLNLWNSGRAPVNVFLLGAPNYSFMSETADPISVPVRQRSIVAMQLSGIGRDGGNAYQVASRLIDYEARLQSRLIMVSTVFGIGISLMVEGAILALLKLARRFGPPERADVASDDLRDEDG
jgi:hypothetical protein